MKNHRYHFLALGAVLLVTLPALRAADETRPEGPPPGERREKMGDRMAEELGLNDEQKAKMKEIGGQERAEIEALKADTSLAKEDRRAKAQEIREKYRGQRDAILTPEQRTKAEKMRAKFRERMEKGGPDAEKRRERREKTGE